MGVLGGNKLSFTEKKSIVIIEMGDAFLITKPCIFYLKLTKTPFLSDVKTRGSHNYSKNVHSDKIIP